MGLFRVPTLIGYLYLSAMWLGVTPRMDTKKDMYLNKTGL